MTTKKSPKKQSSSTKTKTKLPSIRTLQKMLLTHPDPEIRKLVPSIPAGIRILDYMFACVDAAATVKAPRGVKLSAIEVCNKDDRTVLDMECANWLKDCLAEYLGYTEDDVEKPA